MLSDSKPAGVTRVGVLSGVLALGVLLALLLPAIQAAREAARRNSCICHEKGLGLAIHNYHGVKERLPVVTTTNIISAIPGSGAPDPQHVWVVTAGRTALNVGPASNLNVFYRIAANFPNGGGNAWSWGPSSQHSGGAVIHLYADGAVRILLDTVDPTLYVQMVNRAGGKRFVLPGTE